MICNRCICAYAYIYIYIYTCMCVCMCMYVCVNKLDYIQCWVKSFDHF